MLCVLTSAHLDERPMLARFALFGWIVFNIANRPLDTRHVAQKHRPVAACPRLGRMPATGWKCCEWVEVLAFQLPSCLPFQMVHDLLYDIMVACDHQMHMLRKDRTCPDSQTTLCRESTETTPDCPSLNTGETYGGILQHPFGRVCLMVVCSPSDGPTAVGLGCSSEPRQLP